MEEVNFAAPAGRRCILLSFGGRSVPESSTTHTVRSYRPLYRVIYVLHVFQGKSRKGIATPRHEMDLIAARLKGRTRSAEKFSDFRASRI